MSARRRPMSLRRRLLLGILVPVVLLIGFNTAAHYRQALRVANTAYDRTLLASAKSIGEQLEVDGKDDAARLRATVPYSALEIFEADNQTRLFYRVSEQNGRLVSGYDELPLWHGHIPDRPPYAALVDFYDDEFRGNAVRVAVLLQPVASSAGHAIAVIQVAETLQLRRGLARDLLVDTLTGQAALVAVIGLVVVLVVQSATRPIRRLSDELRERPEADLRPLAARDAPRELLPVVDATNQVMRRLRHQLGQQQRFMRDAAHQLRTPLAVLKVQVQSALRGDVPPIDALREIGGTVDRATALAQQMLSLARVDQARHEPDVDAGDGPTDLGAIVRELALDMSPLIAGKDLDFSIATVAAPVAAPGWMQRELVRNLLHNAIRHTPPGGALQLRVSQDGDDAVLVVADSGPGIDDELRGRLFQPFSAGSASGGTGLGLAICREIVASAGGSIALPNRMASDGSVSGLDTTVRLPMSARASV
ncbi:sensor histidine kinase [Xylophilus sp. GOD-11R]|uniref:sensor histidine kinase n=1 Tax=Xylophilus sp. GOD-11R TaxID=3089814 RepID=UPI00298CC889|nr:sensor histidine kinase [Xylophilus sp. GOD-11R]WPB58803.1 sensor histidine kinase [Xylophilus sp. GOD-11R]